MTQKYEKSQTASIPSPTMETAFMFIGQIVVAKEKTIVKKTVPVYPDIPVTGQLAEARTSSAVERALLELSNKIFPVPNEENFPTVTKVIGPLSTDTMQVPGPEFNAAFKEFLRERQERVNNLMDSGKIPRSVGMPSERSQRGIPFPSPGSPPTDFGPHKIVSFNDPKSQKPKGTKQVGDLVYAFLDANPLPNKGEMLIIMVDPSVLTALGVPSVEDALEWFVEMGVTLGQIEMALRNILLQDSTSTISVLIGVTGKGAIFLTTDGSSFRGVTVKDVSQQTWNDLKKFGYVIGIDTDVGINNFAEVTGQKKGKHLVINLSSEFFQRDLISFPGAAQGKDPTPFLDETEVGALAHEMMHVWGIGDPRFITDINGDTVTVRKPTQDEDEALRPIRMGRGLDLPSNPSMPLGVWVWKNIPSFWTPVEIETLRARLTDSGQQVILTT